MRTDIFWSGKQVAANERKNIKIWNLRNKSLPLAMVSDLKRLNLIPCTCGAGIPWTLQCNFPTLSISRCFDGSFGENQLFDDRQFVRLCWFGLSEFLYTKQSSAPASVTNVAVMSSKPLLLLRKIYSSLRNMGFSILFVSASSLTGPFGFTCSPPNDVNRCEWCRFDWVLRNDTCRPCRALDSSNSFCANSLISSSNSISFLNH